MTTLISKAFGLPSKANAFGIDPSLPGLKPAWPSSPTSTPFITGAVCTAPSAINPLWTSNNQILNQSCPSYIDVHQNGTTPWSLGTRAKGNEKQTRGPQSAACSSLLCTKEPIESAPAKQLTHSKLAFLRPHVGCGMNRRRFMQSSVAGGLALAVTPRALFGQAPSVTSS